MFSRFMKLLKKAKKESVTLLSNKKFERYNK